MGIDHSNTIVMLILAILCLLIKLTHDAEIRKIKHTLDNQKKINKELIEMNRELLNIQRVTVTEMIKPVAKAVYELNKSQDSPSEELKN